MPNHSRFLVALIASLSTTALPAIAQGDSQIAHQIVAQAKKCLRLPTAAQWSSYYARLNVTFHAGVAREVQVTDLFPTGVTGKAVVAGATRALERCGPFPDAPDGVITLMFESEE